MWCVDIPPTTQPRPKKMRERDIHTCKQLKYQLGKQRSTRPQCRGKRPLCVPPGHSRGIGGCARAPCVSHFCLEMAASVTVRVRGRVRVRVTERAGVGELMCSPHSKSNTVDRSSHHYLSVALPSPRLLFPPFPSPPFPSPPFPPPPLPSPPLPSPPLPSPPFPSPPLPSPPLPSPLLSPLPSPALLSPALDSTPLLPVPLVDPFSRDPRSLPVSRPASCACSSCGHRER